VVDVGDPVKAGQLLAEIDSPETEEDLRLARVRLSEASANVGIVQRTAQRNENLVGAGVVSQQQADDATAQANSAVAALKTREAELQRVSALHGYQRVVAPFDGVVTRRGYDRGMLVGTASAGGSALFEVAQVDQLRVFVEVPQYLAREVTAGIAAVVYAPAEPQRTARGVVARTSGVLDQATRTLHTEVHIPGDGTVLPGAFVYVRFVLTRSAAPLIVPANTLLVRKEGTLLARVVEGRIALTPVRIGRDLGKDLELLDGIKLGELVVINPQDDLSDGQPVRTVTGGR
jgi:RND family efflux transporter MFP subunit